MADRAVHAYHHSKLLLGWVILGLLGVAAFVVYQKVLL